MRAALLASLFAGAALTDWAQTRIMFYADTEDYTCDESNDGIRDFARRARGQTLKNACLLGFCVGSLDYRT